MPLDAEQFIENTRTDGHCNASESTDRLVPVPEREGLFDYGRISQELAKIAGIAPLPIRLKNGRHFGSGGGYGIAHLIYQHAPSLALLDYFSIQDFVLEVASDFEALYAGRDGRQIIVRRKDQQLRVDRLLVLEVAATADYYSVVTGWAVSARRPINAQLIAKRAKKDDVMVWECRAPHSKGPGEPDPTSEAG